MTQRSRVFGAALDALDMPEKIALKQAYTESTKEDPSQRLPADPYDAVKDFLADRVDASTHVEWIGKFPIESWLCPKPSPEDEKFLESRFFTDFLDKNGCLTYSNQLTSYLMRNVYPARPVMIGVDHGLTGGVLRYLVDVYKDVNVLVFDSHTDIVDFKTKQSFFAVSTGQAPLGPFDIYECGSFLGHLLDENVIKPDRLWILGTQDLLGSEEAVKLNPCVKKLQDWVERGVHLISKADLVRNGLPQQIEGPTYVSIDIDLGCYSSVLACRFVDRMGLELEDFIRIVHQLSNMVKRNQIKLIGLDVMEIDVHFLNEEVSGRRDCTLEIVKRVFDELVFSDYDEN